MTPRPSLSKPWQAAEIDRWMLLVLALNAAGALLLGQQYGQLALALPVSAVLLALPALVVWRLRGSLWSAAAVLLGLGSFTALQIHLSMGQLLYHFNVFVSLSLLLAYRDWRLIAGLAGFFAVHHVGFDRMLANGLGTYCLAAPDPQQIALHVGFVVVQALFLCAVAWRERQLAGESRELAVLVNAMGREGRIRLNLAVMQAQTPAGQRLQLVQQRMAEAIGAVQAAGHRIEAAADDVAEGSTELLRRTEATAVGLRDSAMCLDQIGVIVQHSTDASNEARAMSTSAANLAEDGNRLVAQVVKTMQEIEASSRRINDIIAVIDGIAFQTNLLALNAAVEAARAGEQGRGFAVVAGEVRSLARRSAEAAREIKALIGTSVTTVAAGTRLVAGAGETMNGLVASVRKVGDLFQGVMADTTEQMQGLHTVSQSIAELAESTQQNVAVSNRASDAAAELRAQAGRLGEVLNAFRLSDSLLVAAAEPAGGTASGTGANPTSGTGANPTSGAEPPAPRGAAHPATGPAPAAVLSPPTSKPAPAPAAASAGVEFF